MQKNNVYISDIAKQDLADASDYIAYKLKNPIAAINTVEGIRKHTNTLSAFPERNELDDDPVLANIGIRADYYKNYKIYYMIEENIVFVVRILHMLVDSRF